MKGKYKILIAFIIFIVVVFLIWAYSLPTISSILPIAFFGVGVGAVCLVIYFLITRKVNKQPTEMSSEQAIKRIQEYWSILNPGQSIKVDSDAKIRGGYIGDHKIFSFRGESTSGQDIIFFVDGVTKDVWFDEFHEGASFSDPFISFVAPDFIISPVPNPSQNAFKRHFQRGDKPQQVINIGKERRSGIAMKPEEDKTEDEE